MAVEAARVKSLFLAASDFADTKERAIYLKRECGADHELLARVEALLRADDASPLPELKLEDATGAYANNGRYQDHSDAKQLIGTVIDGKYKLVEEIGEGGMGNVYMAQQTEPVRRAVAVKVIKAGMDSKAVLARFEAERQALAMMDHPNIARVLDAGTTDNGRDSPNEAHCLNQQAEGTHHEPARWLATSALVSLARTLLPQASEVPRRRGAKVAPQRAGRRLR